MKLTLQSAFPGPARLLCAGELTQQDVPDGDPLVALLGPNCYAGPVLVNLERTEYIDSAGVGWLMMRHKQFKEAGGMLILHSIPPLVNNMFQLLRLNAVLHLASDEASAQTLAQGAKP